MSGFFALHRADFEKARDPNPVGCRIGLELIAKNDVKNVAEVPIDYSDGALCESELTFKEQRNYLQHIGRLYIHESGNAMYLLQCLMWAPTALGLTC